MHAHAHRCIFVHKFQLVLIRDITTGPVSPDCQTAEKWFLHLVMMIV